MYREGNLFHTFPESCLELIEENTSVFIEIDAYLKSTKYKDFFKLRTPTLFTVMDCGVGASPNLKDPTGHVSKDMNWAAHYLDAMIEINPSVIVIPDILNDDIATARNFKMYSKILNRMYLPLPQRMYVIQGQKEGQARYQIQEALQYRQIDWIGFPRVVQYYLNEKEDQIDSFEWARRRMDFLRSISTALKTSGKQIHMLGMSSIDELKFAARNGYSIDTRYASMAAIAGVNLNEPRPNGLNIDLTKPISVTTQKQIQQNIIQLNTIYNEYRRPVS